MHYLLFFHGNHRDTKQTLRDAGLNDFTTGAKGLPCVLKDVPGLIPGDVPGLLIGWGDVNDTNRMANDPTLGRVVDLGSVPYKLVLWNESSVTPADLARSAMFDGWNVQFGRQEETLISQLFPPPAESVDPNQMETSWWTVPTAAKLGQDVRLVDGQYTKVRKPMFDGYWNASAVWYRRWELVGFSIEDVLEADRIDWDSPEILKEMVTFVSLALRVNYRITEEIARALGMFSQSSLVRATYSAIDGMAIKEVDDETRRLTELLESRVLDEKKATESTIPDS